MCGIAGIVGAQPGYLADAADVHRMCQTIVHRGPDDEGIYVSGGVGLGMRRLSIIDLSKCHQPIHNEDRSVWVVFNGEIYNFPELRPQLEARGHRFYTNTDTEVIVHLYEEQGPDCVHSLRGMFAFALWDQKRQRLLLARDRFGKKPLHYALHRDRLLFGSEIKAVLAGAPELAEVAPQGLLNFFYFGYIPDPLTAFAQIQKLPPGHLLEFAGGEIKVRQYWNLPSHGVKQPNSEEECLEELEHRLSEAVRIRLISGVPLGALLSGGVDSSTVVALMARAGSRKVKTFSIGFANQDFNEADHARKVAEQFGTEHHELFVEPDIEQTVDNLTHLLEEPFGDSSIVPTYHVCRMARQHVPVLAEPHEAPEPAERVAAVHAELDGAHQRVEDEDPEHDRGREQQEHGDGRLVSQSCSSPCSYGMARPQISIQSCSASSRPLLGRHLLAACLCSGALAFHEGFYGVG